ncbi:TPA: hypothetical protein ACGBRB_004844, partial [Escherichia coli]
LQRSKHSQARILILEIKITNHCRFSRYRVENPTSGLFSLCSNPVGVDTQKILLKVNYPKSL